MYVCQGNLLPSGIIHPDVVCVLGDGMVVDLEHLASEIQSIRDKGVAVSPANLKLSARATISMPWHRVQDELEEARLAKTGSAFGSTKRGIAYAYSDKYRKKTLRLGDLLHLDEKNIKAYSTCVGAGPFVAEKTENKSWEQLPENAKAYVNYIEKQMKYQIEFISTGAERNQYLLKGEWL